MEKLTPEEIADIRALAFFTQTVCHLNPTRASPETMAGYLDAADRVQKLVKEKLS